MGVFKVEPQARGSGARHDRRERARVLALAQAREIDAALVTELSRWGRSTIDPARTPSRRCTPGASWSSPRGGLAFDLATPSGRMMATVLGGVAQFKRELIQERVRSGLAAARARGPRCWDAGRGATTIGPRGP